MWAHLAVRSMPHAPSTMPAKSPATAKTGTGISWHLYTHENSRLHPSVRLKALQLARHSGLTIAGQWSAIAKVATRSIAQCCFPTAPAARGERCEHMNEVTNLAPNEVVEQLEASERLPQDIDPDTLRKYFTLPRPDLEQVDQCRGAANKLGFAEGCRTLRAGNEGSHLGLVHHWYGYTRKYSSVFIERTPFQFAEQSPIGRAVLYMKELNRDQQRKFTSEVPIDFLPRRWVKHVVRKDSSGALVASRPN